MKKIGIAAIFSAMIIGSAVLAGSSVKQNICPDHPNCVCTKAGTTSAAVSNQSKTDTHLCSDPQDCSKCSK